MRHPFFRRILPLVLLAALAPAAHAAWLEGGDPAPQQTASRWATPDSSTPRWVPTPWIDRTPIRPIEDPAARAVRDFLGSTTLGSGQGYGALSIYPVISRSGIGGPSLVALDSATRSGTLRVYEQGSGSVPSVLVENVGRSPVFLMAGEIILGGRQDRVIREDMVVPGRSGPVEVPVYCVEQGRWNSGVSFKSAPEAIADSEMRAAASAGAGQDAIWSHVARKSAAAGVNSSTSAYRDYQSSPEVSRRLDEYVARCPRPSVWRGRVVGAIFVADGQVLGVDLFGDSSLLSALWPKLVRSYAGQVWDRRGYYGRGSDESAARSALAALQSAWPQTIGYAGSGVRLSLSGSGLRATAVTVGNLVAHIGAFGSVYIQDDYDPPPPPPPTPWPTPIWDPPYPRPWYPFPEE